MTRYARQQILPEIGESGQASLAKASVLVVGAGGLGCPALQYLTGAGVGAITIVDGDVVSLSNLHRQVLFRESDVGESKARIAVQTLNALNSGVAFAAIDQPLTPANVDALIDGQTVVLDCADSFAASYILSDACLEAGIPMISASALGLTGYVGGFCGTAPSLRAVFPDLPMQAATCATAGVMGPVVGTIGAMQAQMALAVLLGLAPSPLGQLVTIDLTTYRTGGFRFDGAPEPDKTLGFIAAQDINAHDFVVELRSEARTPVTPTAHRHKVQDFSTLRPTPATGQRAVLTCRSGLRAWQAARHLQGYWDGDISLIAMGDAPDEERPNT